MKISIDIRMLHSSGIGVYLRSLVPLIIRLRPNDQFILMGRPQDRQDPVWQGLTNIQWVDCDSPIYSLRQQWEFHCKTPKDTDLFWSPHYDTALWRPGRLLVTVHDLFHLAMPQFVGGLHKRLYARWMFDRVAAEALGVLAISEFTRNELLRFAGVHPDRVRVILNGLDEGWFSQGRTEVPHPGSYFLYVGNIKPHKNLSRLVEAFGKLTSVFPHDLILVGQKEGFMTGDREVQEAAARLGDRVKFTGSVSQELLKAYYHHAEALVFPSLYEGFGMPPLEAMASGCPVLASTAASIPEVCGNAALYFDPMDLEDMGQKMLRILREPTLRQELIRSGRERAKAFSWNESAIKVSAYMDEIIARDR